MLSLEQFAARVRGSSAIVAFTGAGISTESGIPDFRSPGGLWTRYKPITFQEYLINEQARIESWKRRLESYETTRNARPNKDHHFVAALHTREKLVGVITQNVDGLHADSGLPADKIVELHGSYRKVICLDCAKEFDPELVLKRLVGEFSSPRCDSCGGILKPATVSFGQPMPVDAMRKAEEWTGQAEIFLVMGSSLQVHPAAAFPVIAKRNGALLAIVNREPGPLDEIADYVYHGAIGEFCSSLNALIADG